MRTIEERRAIEQQMLTGRAGIIPALEVRDLDSKKRQLIGRAAPYDVEESAGFYFESLAPGVFARSIKAAAKALPLLLFHDAQSIDTVVGVNLSWQDTRTALDGIWQFDQTDAADEAMARADSGSLGFMSVGFIPKSGELGSTFSWDDDDALHVRRLEARLVETSLTPTPVYAGAVVKKVRSLPRPGTPRFDKWRNWANTLKAGQ